MASSGHFSAKAPSAATRVLESSSSTARLVSRSRVASSGHFSTSVLIALLLKSNWFAALTCDNAITMSRSGSIAATICTQINDPASPSFRA